MKITNKQPCASFDVCFGSKLNLKNDDIFAYIIQGTAGQSAPKEERSHS